MSFSSKCLSIALYCFCWCTRASILLSPYSSQLGAYQSPYNLNRENFCQDVDIEFDDQIQISHAFDRVFFESELSDLFYSLGDIPNVQWLNFLNKKLNSPGFQANQLRLYFLAKVDGPSYSIDSAKCTQNNSWLTEKIKLGAYVLIEFQLSFSSYRDKKNYIQNLDRNMDYQEFLDSLESEDREFLFSVQQRGGDIQSFLNLKYEEFDSLHNCSVIDLDACRTFFRSLYFYIFSDRGLHAQLLKISNTSTPMKESVMQIRIRAGYRDLEFEENFRQRYSFLNEEIENYLKIRNQSVPLEQIRHLINEIETKMDHLKHSLLYSYLDYSL